MNLTELLQKISDQLTEILDELRKAKTAEIETRQATPSPAPTTDDVDWRQRVFDNAPGGRHRRP